MRVRAALLVLLAGSAAVASMPGAVAASGVVTVYHDTCDSLGKGEVSLTLTPADDGAPTNAWTVIVRAQSTEGCSAYAMGVCAGAGALAGGVSLKDCTGPVEGGTFGPVVVCYPGPRRPTLHSVAHDVSVVIDGIYGTFDGTIEADLFGTAVDEAQNICL